MSEAQPPAAGDGLRGQPPLVVGIQAIEVLSYALAHNQVPVVGQITLDGVATGVRGAEVRVSIRDAQGLLSAPFSVPVDLEAGEQTVLRDVPVQLDPSQMSQVEEQRPGEIVVEVLSPELLGDAATEAETLLGSARVPVRILAANQWLRTGAAVTDEILASFVMPNHPAVDTVLQEASTILGERTGSPSLDSYQSGEDRVDDIVQAVVRAAEARQIRYAEPPASWSDRGQKVRNPGEVLEDRIGTCLDLMLAIAAVLEQAGIRPLLFLVEGHAFLGYWRVEAALQNILETDPAAVINLVDLAAIGLVETTLLTAGRESASFAEIQRAPYRAWLTGDADRVQGIVDVFQARQNGIIALPARVRTADHVQVFSYSPVVAPLLQQAGAPTAGRQRTTRDLTPPRVQHWKNALLDLTLRNRLVNFSDRGSLVLSVPDGQLGRLEDVVNEPRLVTLLPRDAIDAIHAGRGISSGWELPPEQRADMLSGRGQVFCDVPTEVYANRMRLLAYKARTIVEESGANNLYLALGSLVWSLDGRPLRSPLVLVPVQLRPASRGGLYRIGLDESGASVPNFCLLEKLRQVHGLEVPGLLEAETDGSGLDLDAALRAVRVAVNGAGLPYRVEETAHVAILQFAKFRLWKDLDEHWPEFRHNDLVRHLIETPNEAFAPPAGGAGDTVDLDSLAAQCPVAADSSQLAAVADAVRGRTFVLEGPPGTGKSQTITNLLTRAMVDGQRVLFVAEKRAALDVVRRRLDDVGMGTFALDLHAKNSRPATVRAQLRQALDADVDVDAQGLAAVGERLRASRQTLDRYAANLHAANAAGLSFYSAHTARLALDDVPRGLPVPQDLVRSGADPTTVTAIRQRLMDLPDTADLVQPRPRHPWGFVRVSPDRLDVTEVRRACADVDSALAELTDGHPLRSVLDRVRSVDELATMASIATAPRAQLWVLDEVRNSFWGPAAQNAQQRTLDFARAWHPGIAEAYPSVLDLPLDDLLQQAQAAAASGFFGRKRRLRAVLEQLRPGLRPDVDVAPRDVPALLQQLVKVQHAAQALAAETNQIAGLALSKRWNPLDPQAAEELNGQVGWLQWASDCVAPSSSLPAGPALRDFLAAEGRLSVAEEAALTRLVAAFNRLALVSGATGDSVAGWSDDSGMLVCWRATAAERQLSDPQLLGLRRWVSFVSALAPLQQAGLDAACSQLLYGSVRAADAVQAFDLGVATASLAERSDSTGLDGFDPAVHEVAVDRFTTSSRAVRDQLTASLPQAVVQQRSFDSAGVSGRIGALRRELGKQRRGLSVRSLVGQYGDLVTALMPCVLVSPDSLSRFFPARADLFDLVVFDEASQIRVADAIGAIGRARAVVVVGDSKQMPPTSFGESSLDLADPDGSDDAELLDTLAVTEDEESILTECVQARVPQRWLSWHYRSQDESLIAFSNALYYADRLSSFPSPHLSDVGPGVDGVGVSLVRVDGVFERTRGPRHRTNAVEAERIVQEVRLRFDASPESLPSIGIVTFNVQQRNLIEGLLRDCGDDRVIEALEANDEGLFVKNLENVQGDERDVVLFSTAFSTDRRGRLPLNFGPLNREGGERRLNVAVTRARRQIIVVSSFDPEQLRAEETSSRGIKDLRTYLDMAAAGPAVLTSLVSRPRRVPARDRHREQVAQVLRDSGLAVATDVGLSDFRIDLSVAPAATPDKPRLAVLLDGPGWASRGTVGDRDGLPVEVLSELMGWPEVRRIWLPAWLRDPGLIVRQLVEAAERVPTEPTGHVEPSGDVQPSGDAEPSGDVVLSAQETDSEWPQLPSGDDRAQLPGPRSRSPEPLPPEPPGPPVPQGQEPEPSPWSGEVFVPWEPVATGSRSVLDALPGPRAAAQVRSVVLEVVALEGPVHADRLARLVARGFGLTRLTEHRTQAILQVVPTQLWDPAGEPFLWPAGRDPGRWSSFRRQSSAAVRPLEQISLREIGNAMVALVQAAAGMSTDDLLRETNSVFGGARLTPGARERLTSALEAAFESGRIAIQHGVATAVPDEGG